MDVSLDIYRGDDDAIRVLANGPRLTVCRYCTTTRMVDRLRIYGAGHFFIDIYTVEAGTCGEGRGSSQIGVGGGVGSGRQ